MLDRPGKDKHSSSLLKFVNYGRNFFFTFGPACEVTSYKEGEIGAYSAGLTILGKLSCTNVIRETI
jgi:hypothetical protein